MSALYSLFCLSFLVGLVKLVQWWLGFHAMYFDILFQKNLLTTNMLVSLIVLCQNLNRWLGYKLHIFFPNFFRWFFRHNFLRIFFLNFLVLVFDFIILHSWFWASAFPALLRAFLNIIHALFGSYFVFSVFLFLLKNLLLFSFRSLFLSNHYIINKS